MFHERGICESSLFRAYRLVLSGASYRKIERSCFTLNWSDETGSVMIVCFLYMKNLFREKSHIYIRKGKSKGVNKIIHIILNGAWLVFVGKDSQTAITMYKIDLGLDEDFNKDYIQKFLEKLKGIDQEYQEQEEDIRNSVLEMDQEMEECDEKIEEHQKLIRDYENRKAGIKESKKSLDVYLNEIDLKRRDIISRLICKKAM